MSADAHSIKEKILTYDQLVPRYTSYPTAPHFQPGLTHQKYASWLEDLPQNTRLSLYIHVPFCPKMCWYCGCHTKITKRYEPVKQYTRLIEREIDILSKILGRNRPVTHIHFGGGSPGILNAADFSSIMQRLENNFTIADNAEIAFEIDPREITESRIKAYAKHGLNRASIGVQDFDDKVLKAVNREQPFELTKNTVALLREHGINGINFDLLYGLPEQSIDTITRTIEQSLTLAPERFAFFGYAHVPWMKKHMRMIDENALPEKEERYDMFERAASMLSANGYEQIGIDHFAKPGDALLTAFKNKTLRRNFQGYTTDTADAMIGLGVSSIGKMPQGFTQNAPDMPVYSKAIEKEELPAIKSCPLSSEDLLRADIIEQIMCFFEVDIPTICKKHHVNENHLSAELESLQEFIDDGLVILSEDKILSIPGQARMLTRLIAAAFDEYLAQTRAQIAPRHARAI